MGMNSYSSYAFLRYTLQACKACACSMRNAHTYSIHDTTSMYVSVNTPKQHARNIVISTKKALPHLPHR